MNADLHLIKTELFDPDVMEVILRDPGFSKKSREQLGRYAKNREHANRVKVEYCYGKRWEDIHFGRIYPKGGLGLQSFPFDMRNPLLEKYYWDVDMENCHYIILAKMADDWGLPTEAIHQYIDNRDEELARVSSIRKVAKTAFIKIAYGGDIKLYDVRYDDDGVAEGDMTLIRRIEKEMNPIVDRVWNEHKHLHARVRGTKNPKFSLFAHVLQNEEKRCLDAMDIYFQSKGRSMDVPVHDGGSVRKLDGEVELHPSHLLNAANAILNATGYQHQLVVKPWSHGFKMPEKAEVASALINDDHAAKVFVGCMGSHICKDKDVVFYFNLETGMWESGEAAFRACVHRHRDALVFRESLEGTLGTRVKIHDYSGTEKKIVAFRPSVRNYCVERDLFCEANLEKTYYKLLFKNGIFDFHTGFTRGFDESLVFQRRINRDFSSVRDAEREAEVLNTLFVHPFKDMEVGVYLLKTLIIAMVGDYSRKKFYFGIGPTNCGKGVLTGAMENTFGGYVDTWNADELLYNPRSGSDRAKRLAWIKDIKGRLAFSNEIRMERSQIDMNLVKAVSSGGDGILARKNFQDQEKDVNRASMFLLANDIPEFAPKDDATEDRAIILPYGYSFTTHVTLKPGQKRADPNVKNMFLKEEYRNALFWLFADGFESMTENERRWGGTIEPPSSVKAETQEYSGDGSTDFNEAFNEAFEVTNDPNDKVISSTILKHLVEVKRLRHSPQKIAKLIGGLIELTDGSDPKVQVGSARLKGWAGVRPRG